VLGVGVFRRNDPHPFALLPYGMVRYHGAPAELRDIPLGTILHVTAYLPPDPKLSSVPVLPVDNKDRDANHYRGIGVFPAENHVLLLEDEPSYCQRMGLALYSSKERGPRRVGSGSVRRTMPAFLAHSTHSDVRWVDRATLLRRQCGQQGTTGYQAPSLMRCSPMPGLIAHQERAWQATTHS
jgi:hypothetical protein